ncbi:MAG: monooxygenase [Deltaproteobacteria bacterium]|nr:monooxygenase [Deltaproteobacteria bacterium]
MQTQLCQMLEIEVPIIAFTHCKDVAVAATNAGGFAVLGEAMHTVDEIAEDVGYIRERVDGKPFGIDLVFPAKAPPGGTPDELYAKIPQAQREFADRIKSDFDVPPPRNEVALRQWGGLNAQMARAQIDALLDLRVPLIATGLGCPEFLFEAAHERDILICGLVGTAKQARRQIERGADAIVAQGYDAAGHTGAVGTFSAVPQIVSVAGDVPVIAAGGVAGGRHLAAALCLGAVGVWVGTAWLASEESDLDPILIERILESTGDDTTRSRAISGKTMRVLDCPWTSEWERPEAPEFLGSPYQMLLTSNYLQGANDARRPDLMTEAVGQGVALLRERRPTAEILTEMAAEARSTLQRLRG